MALMVELCQDGGGCTRQTRQQGTYGVVVHGGVVVVIGEVHLGAPDVIGHGRIGGCQGSIRACGQQREFVSGL